jgi:hypothetical protein
MSYPILNFGRALQNALLSDQCLLDLSCHGQVLNSSRGFTHIGIAERGPNIASVTPFIGWEVVDTEPLLADIDTSGWYMSKVFIFVVETDSFRSTRLADAVQNFFTNQPADYNQFKRWFRDISDGCILNRCTSFVSRLRFGRQGQNTTDMNQNVWINAVELDFIWTDRAACLCGTECEEPTIDDCPQDTNDIETGDCSCPTPISPNFEI